MRGDAYLSQAPAGVTEEAPAASATVTAPMTGSNVEENLAPAVQNSIWFWAGVLGLYALYFWLYNKKLKDAVNADAALAFIHNALSVTILAVLGINGANVFLTKLSALNIPILSRGAGSILPLFHL